MVRARATRGCSGAEGAQQGLDGAIDFRGSLVEFSPLGEQLRHRETGRREIGVAGSERALLRGERFFEKLLRAVLLAEIEFHPRQVAHRRRDTGMVITQRGAKVRDRGRRTDRPQLDSSPNPNAQGPDSSEP